MFSTCSPGAIGVTAGSLPELIKLAAKHGFGGVEVPIHEVADRIESDGVEAVRGLFEASNIRPGAFGVPINWRGDEATWREGLSGLPRLAKAAEAIGCLRSPTYIFSWSDDLPYDENLEFHIARFQPIAQIYLDHGIALGLEFLGPKTLRDGKAHAFIHTMSAMLDMAAAIGPNVGLLLDAWHWYTSHSDLAELGALTAAQVTYVHVNDAPAGIAIDEQIDNVRELPGATGVIDMTGFLQTLERIGYDGPVTPEPFKADLHDLANDDERMAVVAASMHNIFEAALS